jgi:cytochrome c oxidase assembly protein subunit 15
MMQSDKKILITVKATTVLAFIVVVLGAYVRLSDAGLGCPDWPGCYGKMIVPFEVSHVQDIYPERPLEHGKAWKEMIHRYAAGILGLLVLMLAVFSWQQRKQPGQPLVVPSLLVLLLIFQALLGMWTVTLLLKPVIVMGHLVGGMTILSLLLWMTLELGKEPQKVDLNNGRLYPWAITGLIVMIIQISLGGWTSANYAALVCPDFPKCQGVWWPAMDFKEGFVFWRGLGIDYEGGILHGNARTAIHMAHRIGAAFTVLIVSIVAIRAISDSNKRTAGLGTVILLVLITQVGLGIANVLMRLPLPLAVAHNGVAALLLLSLVALLHQSVIPVIKRRMY